MTIDSILPLCLLSKTNHRGETYHYAIYFTLCPTDYFVKLLNATRTLHTWLRIWLVVGSIR